MQKRNILNSPRLLELKKSRRRAFYRKIFIFIFGFSAIIAASSYVSRIDKLNIKNVEVVGNKIIEKEIVQKIVQEKISGNYLWIFPKTNIFFYSKNVIVRTLYNELKRLKEVNLSVKDKTTLEVSLLEREALYTWCGETPVAEEKCYFMDENGFIFDEAPYFSGEVYFKFYGPVVSNGNSPLGSSFSGQNFAKIISLKKTFESIRLKPVALHINGDNIKFMLSSSAPKAPEIILKFGSNWEVVAENLQTALVAEPLRSKFKNKYSSLEYIDLRYGNKVYFKFSNE